MDLKEKLLKSLLPVSEAVEIPRHVEVVCAVLLPLGLNPQTQQVEILMTKRTSKVLTHKGQISFPGGMREKEDASILDTALRESWEEVGLQSAHVEILGRLPAVTTHTTNLLIFPFVGFISLPYAFEVNAEEVDKLLMVPLHIILKDGVPPRQVEINGFKISSIGFEFDGELIWGASARMLEDLRKVLI